MRLVGAVGRHEVSPSERSIAAECCINSDCLAPQQQLLVSHVRPMRNSPPPASTSDTMKANSLRKWKAIHPSGDIIVDTFVPFKTPFDNTRVDPRFTVDDFVRMLRDVYRDKIGLVIDLTRTDKYYNKRALSRCGIEHYKFPCRGFDDTPSSQEVRGFLAKCDSFLRRHPGQLIVVHCTHGCNRTGYLICAYLIRILNFDPLDAIRLFQDARPPGIHKMFVIERILDHYGTDKRRSEVNRFMNRESARLRELGWEND